MDFSQLNQDQLQSFVNLLQSFQRGQSQLPANSSSDSNQLNSGQENHLSVTQQNSRNISPQPQTPSQLSLAAQTHAHPHPISSSSSNAPIQPYQSGNSSMAQRRVPGPAASRGHPSPFTSSLSSASDPFLGLSALDISTRDRVNQQRRTSAARLPTSMQPRLPSRPRRRRGPAERLPSMPCTSMPSILDCLSNMPDGVEIIRITVKVYPPQV